MPRDGGFWSEKGTDNAFELTGKALQTPLLGKSQTATEHRLFWDKGVPRDRAFVAVAARCSRTESYLILQNNRKTVSKEAARAVAGSASSFEAEIH